MSVLLEIVERLYARIGGFNVCVLLQSVERLYAGIDDYMLELMVSMCVFSWNLLKDYMLELMVSMCVFYWNIVTVYMPGLSQHVYVCVHVELFILQRICVSLQKLSYLQRMSIRCRIVCSQRNL